jgi:glycogen operon protein
MTNHPIVTKMIVDCLEYWVREMHVDGFRFDEAAVLTRGARGEVLDEPPVVWQIELSETLADTKIIAEAWDAAGAYEVGRYPGYRWAEWNGKYRDCVRDFWRGEDQTLAEFAYRVTGSSDLYERTGRRPIASVNFVTAHDGFTLADLTAYNDKHNDANGEGGADGESHNRSWNCGAEGPTEDPDVLALRAKQRRNFLATLLLSQGTPMLLGGDEMGRSQRGNNNAYCQDNEISWYDWEHMDGMLVTFTRRLLDLRRRHPVFRRVDYFEGRPLHGGGVVDVAWFRPDGSEMDDADWASGFAKAVGLFLNGDAIPTPGPRGERIVDDSFLLLFNAHHEDIAFTLPPENFADSWIRVIDTADELSEGESSKAGEQVQVEGISLAVFRRIGPPVG